MQHNDLQCNNTTVSPCSVVTVPSLSHLSAVISNYFGLGPANFHWSAPDLQLIGNHLYG